MVHYNHDWQSLSRNGPALIQNKRESNIVDVRATSMGVAIEDTAYTFNLLGERWACSVVQSVCGSLSPYHAFAYRTDEVAIHISQPRLHCEHPMLILAFLKKHLFQHKDLAAYGTPPVCSYMPIRPRPSFQSCDMLRSCAIRERATLFARCW